MCRVSHILVAVAALFSAVSCADRPKVIPEKRLELIYEDMFIADQWLRDHSEYSSLADSTLFFDPIFAKYGYDFEDYDATLKYYTARPDVFSELITRVSDRLSAKSEEFTRLGNEYAMIEGANNRNRIRYRPWTFDPLTLPLDMRELDDSLGKDERNRDSLSLVSDVAVRAAKIETESASPEEDEQKALFISLRQADTTKAFLLPRSGQIRR